MSQVNQIKEAINIIDVIGERLQLKLSGSNYKALCPFHHEKSPSFFVSEQLQRYKCFGCGASGDVIEFLEQYEGMTFVEVLEYLADRAGIKLDNYSYSAADETRKRLLEIMNLAAQYYHYLLTKHQVGKKALDFAKQRGISNSSIKLFKLGYSLDSWEGLIDYLHKKKNYSISDIHKAGLTVQNKSNRYYDRFRNRLMFPLKDHRGRIIGFSGRVLDQNAKSAKYINTPETMVYHKAELLYGYSELFREIKKKKQVIVVEGEIDVVTSSQMDVNNIVAIKGSALTQKQAKLLDRAVDKIILCLDNDSAGETATRRALEVISSTNLTIGVIDLSKHPLKPKDPDELIKQKPQAWRELSKHPISVYEYFIRRAFSQFDEKKPDGKKQIIKQLAPILQHIDYEVEKDFYINKVAEKLNVRPSVIKQDLNKVLRVSQLSGHKSAQSKSAKNEDSDKKDQLETHLINLLFKFDSDQIKLKINELVDLEFQQSGMKQIIRKIEDFSGPFNLEKFGQDLPEDLKAKLLEWTVDTQYNNFTTDQLKAEWKITKKRVRQQSIQRKINKLEEKIENLDKIQNKSNTQENQLQTYLKEIAVLQSKLR